MRKITVWSILLVLVASAPLFAGKAGEVPKNIILIGWDGAQRNHVNECLKRGELPNLKRLAGRGTMVNIDIVGTTDTKAGWAEILTGYGPAITGVYRNARYRMIPKGLTVFERLEKHFGPDNFVTLAVIGKYSNVDADPPGKKRLDDQQDEKNPARGKGGKPQLKKRRRRNIFMEDGIRYRLTPGKPYYHAKGGVDLFLNGLTKDEIVGTVAIQLIRIHKDKPFFFFVHFAEVDKMGHRHNENSKQYNDALISADTWTGRIIETLKKLKLYDKTLIYVTADHGFDEGKKAHWDAPFVFLATNDREVIRGGTRADIAATILERFGVDLKKIEPKLDGSPLTKPKPKTPKAAKAEPDAVAPSP